MGLNDWGEEDLRRPLEILCYAMAMNRIIDFRARSAHNAQIVDVHYAGMLRDPLAVAERIYMHFQIPLTEEARQAMAAYLAENRHGTHQYALSACGLDENDIERYYGPYIDHYKVERETRS